MPKTEIELPYRIEHVSILDENGRLDESLEPDLSDDFLLKLYRTLVQGRRFDERMLSLQRQGRIGTFAPVKGQEASQLGAVAALQPEDWMVPCFREMVAQLWRGAAMENFLLYYAGYDEAVDIAPEQNDLPVSIPVASQLPHAVGLAWGMKYRNRPQVAMTFFGDGATSEGDFHEALNFAAVFQVPTVFVCQNNQWAISVPRNKQTQSKTLAQKALAYDMPAIQVDGNDILAVYSAAKEAVDRARNGGGPTLIECVTYRMSVHTTADDPTRYRTDEEVAVWEKRDPIDRFTKYLIGKGLLDEAKIEQIETAVKQEIQAAVDRAEAKMKEDPDLLDLFEYMFEEMPGTVQEQREEFIRDQAADREEAHHG